MRWRTPAGSGGATGLMESHKHPPLDETDTNAVVPSARIDDDGQDHSCPDLHGQEDDSGVALRGAVGESALGGLPQSPSEQDDEEFDDRRHLSQSAEPPGGPSTSSLLPSLPPSELPVGLSASEVTSLDGGPGTLQPSVPQNVLPLSSDDVDSTLDSRRREVSSFAHSPPTVWTVQNQQSTCEFTHTITQYAQKRESGCKKAEYSDTTIDSFGNRWRLIVYVNGNGRASNHHLSLFLQVADADELPFGWKKAVSYVLTLEHPTGSSLGYAKRNPDKTFKLCPKAIDWGWSQFITSDRIQQEGYISNDTLTVRATVTVKSSSVSIDEEDAELYLKCAVEEGNADAVSACLSQGASVNCQFKDDLYTPLHTACSSSSGDGSLEVLKLLLKRGADGNACNKWRETPLLIAANNGYRAAVEALLDHGADPCLCSEAGWSALTFAAHKGYEDIVDLLLTARAEVNCRVTEDLSTPLHKACAGGKPGHLKSVQLLLDGGADVHALNKWRETPLLTAANHGQAGAVEALLRAGGDPCKCTDTGWSPLSIAAYKGHDDVVRLLLEEGAPTEEADPTLSALLQAATKGLPETVELLLRHGADHTVTTKKGDTALSILVEQNLIDAAVEMVTEYKASVPRCSRDRKKVQRARLLINLRVKQQQREGLLNGNLGSEDDDEDDSEQDESDDGSNSALHDSDGSPKTSVASSAKKKKKSRKEKSSAKAEADARAAEEALLLELEQEDLKAQKEEASSSKRAKKKKKQRERERQKLLEEKQHREKEEAELRELERRRKEEDKKKELERKEIEAMHAEALHLESGDVNRSEITSVSSSGENYSLSNGEHSIPKKDRRGTPGKSRPSSTTTSRDGLDTNLANLAMNLMLEESVGKSAVSSSAQSSTIRTAGGVDSNDEATGWSSTREDRKNNPVNPSYERQRGGQASKSTLSPSASRKSQKQEAHPPVRTESPGPLSREADSKSRLSPGDGPGKDRLRARRKPAASVEDQLENMANGVMGFLGFDSRTSAVLEKQPQPSDLSQANNSISQNNHGLEQNAKRATSPEKSTSSLVSEHSFEVPGVSVLRQEKLTAIIEKCANSGAHSEAPSSRDAMKFIETETVKRVIYRWVVRAAHDTADFLDPLIPSWSNFDDLVAFFQRQLITESRRNSKSGTGASVSMESLKEAGSSLALVCRSAAKEVDDAKAKWKQHLVTDWTDSALGLTASESVVGGTSVFVLDWAGSARVLLPSEALLKLQTRYRGKPERFLAVVFSTMKRYETLRMIISGTDVVYSLAPMVLSTLGKELKVTMELWADPLSVFGSNSFCGTFEDIDTFFGGLKPFGRGADEGGESLLLRYGGSVVLLPPRDSAMTSLFVHKISDLLENSTVALSFVLILPSECFLDPSSLRHVRDLGVLDARLGSSLRSSVRVAEILPHATHLFESENGDALVEAGSRDCLFVILQNDMGGDVFPAGEMALSRIVDCMKGRTGRDLPTSPNSRVAGVLPSHGNPAGDQVSAGFLPFGAAMQGNSPDGLVAVTGNILPLQSNFSVGKTSNVESGSGLIERGPSPIIPQSLGVEPSRYAGRRGRLVELVDGDDTGASAMDVVSGLLNNLDVSMFQDGSSQNLDIEALSLMGIGGESDSSGAAVFGRFG